MKSLYRLGDYEFCSLNPVGNLQVGNLQVSVKK